MANIFREYDGSVHPLASGDVHIYVQPLTDDFEGEWRHLIPSERAKAERFRLPLKRHEYVHTRSLLRVLLGGYLSIEPSRVPIEYTDFGKPHLPDDLGLHFNVSHTEGMAVFAFSVQRVGIDVEHPRRIDDPLGLVERFFSRDEHAAFRLLENHEQQRAFLRAWTRKEAILKAIGRGVQVLDCCDVTFGKNDPPRLLRLFDDTTAGDHWDLFAWEPAHGYLAALAVEKA